VAEPFNQEDTPTRFARVVTELRPGATFSMYRSPDAAQFVATWGDDTRIVTEHWAIRGLNHSQLVHYLKPHIAAVQAAAIGA